MVAFLPAQPPADFHVKPMIESPWLVMLDHSSCPYYTQSNSCHDSMQLLTGPPYKGLLHTQHTTIRFFQHFAASTRMNNTCTIFCLTNAFHSSPSPTEVCPRAPCLKEIDRARTFSSYWSFSRELITSKMQLSRSSRSTTNSYSRCVMCLCTCEHVSACIHSLCEHCCRLCNNSKVDNEKFRGAIVFDVVGQFLTTLR